MTTPNTDDSGCEFLTKAKVKRRYGDVSDMWIFRKQRDAGFPAAVYFSERSRPYWRLSELLEWERRTLRADTAKKGQPPKKRPANVRVSDGADFS